MHMRACEKGYQYGSSEEFLDRVIIHWLGLKEAMLELQKGVKGRHRPVGILHCVAENPPK